MAITLAWDHRGGSSPSATSIALKTGTALTIRTVGTTSTNYSKPFLELDYYWSVDGGVPSAYTYGDRRIHPSRFIGPIATFPFVIAGTWHITLLVTEPDASAAWATVEFTVTVTDAGAVAYLDADAPGGGDGSLATPWNDFATAWAWYKMSNASLTALGGSLELRIKAGTTYTLSTGLGDITGLQGFRRITSYGSGANPVLNMGGINIWNTTGATPTQDLLVDQLDINSTTQRAFSPLGTRIAYSRGKLSTTAQYTISQTGGRAEYDFSDSSWWDFQSNAALYGFFAFPPASVADPNARSLRRAVIAGEFKSLGATATQSMLRAQWANSVIYGCTSDWTSTHGAGCRLASEYNGVAAENTYVGYCDFITAGSVGGTITTTSASGGTFSNVLIEACRVRSDAGAAQVHDVEGSNVDLLFKNCIIHLTAVGGQQFVDGASYTITRCRLLHCTFVSEARAVQALRFQGTTTGTEMRNCCVRIIPNAANTYCVQTTGEDFTAVVLDHNWIDTGDSTANRLGLFAGVAKTFAEYEAQHAGSGYTNINGAGLDPLLDADLVPTAGSPLLAAGRDMGAAVPVRRDFGGTVRPHGAMTIGAREPAAAAGQLKRMYAAALTAGEVGL